MIDCPTCNGSGMMIITGHASKPRKYTLHVGHVCPRCKGSGRWFTTEEVKEKAKQLGGEQWLDHVDTAVNILTKESTQ